MKKPRRHQPKPPQQALHTRRDGGTLAHRPAVAPQGPLTLPATMALAGMGLSQLGLTESERQALLAPFSDHEMEILPSGEVYTPWVYLGARLNQIFGPGNWGRMSEPPQEKGGSIIQKWTLLIRGRPVAEAYGEARYIAANPKHSWGKALETARSNGLTRTCKDLGMAAQCWMRRFQYTYRLRQGVLVKTRGKHGVESQWRHIDSPPLPGEFAIDERSPNRERYIAPNEAHRAAGEALWRPTTEDEQPTVDRQEARAAELVPYGDGLIGKEARKAIFAALKTHERSESDLKAFLKQQWGYDSTRQIRQSQVTALLDYLRAPYDL